MNLGCPAYLRPKGTGDRSMPEKREATAVSQVAAPQGPHGMAKATLPEVQSRSDIWWSRRHAGFRRRHPMRPSWLPRDSSP
jgi:hypothetical protein